MYELARDWPALRGVKENGWVILRRISLERIVKKWGLKTVRNPTAIQYYWLTKPYWIAHG